MNLKNIKVSRVMTYNPDAYLGYCEESGITPSQEGFMAFIQDWIDEDFRNSNDTQNIEEIDCAD